ncbi:MAG: serine hydrolase [Phycisphaerales bacterium]|nr:serine hydrolase [Phycisphaerales bacterium]
MRTPITSIICLTSAAIFAIASLASAGYDTLRDFMEALVEQGQVVGCMAEVTRNGDVTFLDAFGSYSPDSETPLGIDAVVRIYSMTKPITSLAAMILAEEGKLSLDDPVSKYIPEFADVKVATWPDGAAKTRENAVMRPPSRPIMVRDLLVHTSGLGYRFSVPPEYESWYANIWTKATTLEEAAKYMAAVPLVHDPGTAFLYGINTDVLGRVIEVAAAQPFEDFLQERIFTPLQMDNTGFRPSDPKGVMPIVRRSDETGELEIEGTHFAGDEPSDNSYLPLGGEGLYSTLHDYTRFCLVMLGEGELDGTRIVTPRTVHYMTHNHLAPNIKASDLYFGMGVSTSDAVQTAYGPRGLGRYGWGGAACTYFFVDPSQDLTAVFATQLRPFNADLGKAFPAAVLESVASEEATQP